ncbi:hypothetical protein, partial [Maribellus maritimus]|uniref:hypothetical protein n=1 Tax=Maribellus maritimus TaxID=2870838 RepID=UPI001EEC0837
WTVTDSCAAPITCSASFTVPPAVVPTITCPTDPNLPACTDQATIQNEYNNWADGFTYSGGCDDPTDNIDEIPPLTDMTCGGQLSFTYIVADLCDTVECTSTFTVAGDTIPPATTCPPDANYEACDLSIIQTETTLSYTETETTITLAELQAAGGTANDNCAIGEIIYFDDSTGICPITIIRTFTVTDECGNNDTCQQIITIDDTIIPEITCPPDTTIFTVTDTAPSYTGWATGTDNCDPNLQITYTDSIVPGNNPLEFTIYRIWEAADACDNKITCPQIIKTGDNTPPEITCPEDIDVECFELLDTSITGVATAIDECMPVTITFRDSSDNNWCPETIYRTWIATDNCGNSDECVQRITLNDTIPPEIICPADESYEACSIEEADTMLSLPYSETVRIITLDELLSAGGDASDNCSIKEINYFDASSGICPITIVRTFTVIDSCDNTDDCIQFITIKDSTPPVFDVCPPDITITCDQSTDTIVTGSPV